MADLKPRLPFSNSIPKLGSTMNHYPTPIRFSLLTLSLLASNLRVLAADATPAPAATTDQATAAPATTASTTPPKSTALKDADGRTVYKTATTGHITNYYEDKIPPYTLPDPLVLANGTPVKDADTWFKQRRPEIIEYYKEDIYGRVPATAPKVTWQVASTDPAALNGAAVMKKLVGTFGSGPDAPQMNVTLYTPAKATGPVPVVLSLSFGFGGGAAPSPNLSLTTVDPTKVPATPPAPVPGAARGRGRGPIGPGEPVADIIARGYGYAVVRYTEIEHDTQYQPNVDIVRKLALAPGQDKPAPDEWGTISAWAWGASRIMDYFETDKDVDAKRVALVGHSRLGKTVLWAGAQDTRFSIVFSSQGGELGSSIGRRDYGETIDDMAQNYGYQFAGNLQKYAGHWNDMPVDTHFLISLIAPRPLLITGGTGDQWSDPHGEFLGEVAAGPVYQLTGAKDLGTNQWPAPEVPLIAGDLAYYYHTGPHAITPADWVVFLNFADKYWQTKK